MQLLPSWRVEGFLWSDVSAKPQPSGPTAATPARELRALGWPGRIRRRAYLLLRGCNPRLPCGAATFPAVVRATATASSASRGGRAANHGMQSARSILGRKQEPWEMPRRTFLEAEVKRVFASQCPLGVAPCTAASRILSSSTTSHLFISSNVAPGPVPGFRGEPSRLNP